MTGVGVLFGYYKGLKLFRSGLRTECQSPLGWTLSSDRSLVSFKKKKRERKLIKKMKWVNEWKKNYIKYE